MKRSCFLLLASLLLGTTGATTPSPVPIAPLTAHEVLARVAATITSVRSYRVPLTMSGNVKVGFISLPFSMNGTEYFKAPDKDAMQLDNVPSLAKGFEHTMSSMGTPQTWEQTYAISLVGTQPRGKHVAYVLSGTPRHPGNVKSATMWVNRTSYAIEAVRFSYNNGATLDLELSHHGVSPHHVPTSIAVNASFPQYSGHAVIQYGTYEFNVPIADSVFEK